VCLGVWQRARGAISRRREAGGRGVQLSQHHHVLPACGIF
jgi:hypothetical protein